MTQSQLQPEQLVTTSSMLLNTEHKVLSICQTANGHIEECLRVLESNMTAVFLCTAATQLH